MLPKKRRADPSLIYTTHMVKNNLMHNIPETPLQIFVLRGANPPSSHAIIYLNRQIANFLRGGTNQLDTR